MSFINHLVSIKSKRFDCQKLAETLKNNTESKECELRKLGMDYQVRQFPGYKGLILSFQTERQGQLTAHTVETGPWQIDSDDIEMGVEITLIQMEDEGVIQGFSVQDQNTFEKDMDLSEATARYDSLVRKGIEEQSIDIDIEFAR